jgi:Zn-dependent alcohol dehydrogenase
VRLAGLDDALDLGVSPSSDLRLLVVGCGGEWLVTQKAIMGPVYGFAGPRRQIPELLALYRDGALKLRELITRTYRIHEINAGYPDLDAGKNLRGVVVFDNAG